MTGQQLKNSILQMAVQGKLVPQDPNDEPASVLLERIRREKERLVREKKIRPEKNPSVIFRGADNLPYEKRGNQVRCIADEIPFEIPDSWEWVRLPHIAESELGKTLDKARNTGETKPYLCSINVYWTGIDLSEVKQAKFEPQEKEKYRLFDGDLLICEGGDVGRCAIWHGTNEMYYQNALHRVRFYGEVLPEYFQLILEAYKGSGLIDEASKGMTIKHFTQTALYTLFFPLPPMKEQGRILKKMKILSSCLVEYKNKEDEITLLNTSLPSLLKKSILQEAIQGKLVPQDPNDEPASVLLERIRREKARLVKEGKLKPDKHESVIFRRDNSHYEKLNGKERCIDDEIPFEIPDNWAWARLNSLCFSIADGDHQPPPQVATGVPFLVISNVSTGYLNFKNVRHVPQRYFNELAASRKPEKGDLLFTVTGSFGIVVPIEDDTDFCFQRHMALLKMPKYLASIWLAKWLQSPMVLEKCKEEATGTAQKTVSLNTLRNLILPVPPLAEQSRILRQLSTLMYMLTNQ